LAVVSGVLSAITFWLLMSEVVVLPVTWVVPFRARLAHAEQNTLFEVRLLWFHPTASSNVSFHFEVTS